VSRLKMFGKVGDGWGVNMFVSVEIHFLSILIFDLVEVLKSINFSSVSSYFFREIKHNKQIFYT